MYEVVFTRKAGDFVKSLPKAHKNRLKKILEELKDNPFSHPYRKIRGKVGLHRIRLGQYRVLYEVKEEQKIVVILKIDKRSKAYK